MTKTVKVKGHERGVSKRGMKTYKVRIPNTEGPDEVKRMSRSQIKQYIDYDSSAFYWGNTYLGEFAEEDQYKELSMDKLDGYLEDMAQYVIETFRVK